MSPRILLPPVLQRRLAVAIRHRLRPHCQSFSTTSQNPAPRLRPPTKLRPSTTPPPTALSALLSRLSLQPRVDLHDALIACITHPSYLASPSDTVTHSDTEGEVPTETNELLATLGNSLLGLFASEHLTSQYPYLPTEALKQAVTAYVGPVTCLSVARELGLAASGGGNLGIIGQGRGSASAGIAVRYHRTRVDEGGVPDGPETVPGARRFRKYEDAGSEGSERLRELRIADKRRARNREGFEDVVASSVRAFVGLIYQEAVSYPIFTRQVWVGK
jgi:large subunit ribosomal protein L44